MQEKDRDKLKDIFSKVLGVKNGIEQLKSSDVLEWNSMRHMFLIYSAENEFKIKISPNDYKKMSESFHGFKKVISDYIRG